MSEEDLSYSYFTTKNQEQGASSDMSTSLLHLAKWLCHTITRNEFDSLMVILLEIQGGSHPDFTFKAERPSPNYWDFRQVGAPPLREPPADRPALGLDDWRDRLAARERERGRALPHVRARAGALPLRGLRRTAQLPLSQRRPEGDAVQVQGLQPSRGDREARPWEPVRPVVPHCGSSLYRWQERGEENLYKCGNDSRPHYLKRLAELTPEERARREGIRHDPNFKLRYQHREYHFDRTAPGACGPNAPP